MLGIAVSKQTSRASALFRGAERASSTRLPPMLRLCEFEGGSAYDQIRGCNIMWASGR